MLDRFTWFWQSAYRWAGDGLTVYIDPVELRGENDPADLIFITHAHFDHFRPEDIEGIRTDATQIVAPRDVANELSGEVRAVSPGDADEIKGVRYEAVPAYNIVEHRLQAHPKDNNWVGYVLELGGNTYYHAGDTDHVPELDQVRANVTFLPIGEGGYTMHAGEAADLAKAISPQIAVPMHYGFVEGCRGRDEAETFRRDADPITVELLEPRVPFEF
jgi:L-ascorbate metabolism protein UlaG (beta-lactamase superfamily)